MRRVGKATWLLATSGSVATCPQSASGRSLPVMVTKPAGEFDPIGGQKRDMKIYENKASGTWALLSITSKVSQEGFALDPA